MPGDLTYTWEKFVTAADSMATSEGTLRERLLDAYRSEAMHGAFLRAGAGKMTPAKLRLAAASMGQPDTKVADLCEELGITRQTLYRHVSPNGELRPDGLRLLAAGKASQRKVDPVSG